MQTYYHYKGVLHVHSTYSDGQKSIPEIAAIANQLQLNFLLLSDHNTLQPKMDGLEGWYGSVLLGIGSELNDADDKNHYLAFNIHKEIPFGLDAETYVRRVKEEGGFGIIAHPDENRSHIKAYPPYPWTIWNSQDFDGIEIWNHMSEWMEGLTNWNKFWRILHPRRSIRSPKKETLRRWDTLNSQRKVVGVGGVDAHGHVHRIWGLVPMRVFRYKISFRTIRTHVLTKAPLPRDNATEALQLIYEALRYGRAFVAHNLLGDASEFRFFAERSGQRADMGDTLHGGTSTVFHVQAPSDRALIRLLRNGDVVGEQKGGSAQFKTEHTGVYRTEVWRDKRPWIFSNHIRIQNPDTQRV